MMHFMASRISRFGVGVASFWIRCCVGLGSVGVGLGSERRLFWIRCCIGLESVWHRFWVNAASARSRCGIGLGSVWRLYGGVTEVLSHTDETDNTPRIGQFGDRC